MKSEQQRPNDPDTESGVPLGVTPVSFRLDVDNGDNHDVGGGHYLLGLNKSYNVKGIVTDSDGGEHTLNAYDWLNNVTLVNQIPEELQSDISVTSWDVNADENCNVSIVTSSQPIENIPTTPTLVGSYITPYVDNVTVAYTHENGDTYNTSINLQTVVEFTTVGMTPVTNNVRYGDTRQMTFNLKDVYGNTYIVDHTNPYQGIKVTPTQHTVESYDHNLLDHVMNTPEIAHLADHIPNLIQQTIENNFYDAVDNGCIVSVNGVFDSTTIAKSPVSINDALDDMLNEAGITHDPPEQGYVAYNIKVSISCDNLISESGPYQIDGVLYDINVLEPLQ